MQNQHPRTGKAASPSAARELVAGQRVFDRYYLKRTLGEDFPVFYRFHGSEFLKGGYGIEGSGGGGKHFVHNSLLEIDGSNDTT